MSEPLKPRRRWLQFSLRTLMLLMVFAAGYFAGFATLLRRSQEMHDRAMQAEHAARASELLAREQAEVARLQAEAALAELRKSSSK